jgi:hypothetical protein
VFAFYTISFSLTKIEMSEFPEKTPEKAIKTRKTGLITKISKHLTHYRSNCFLNHKGYVLVVSGNA